MAQRTRTILECDNCGKTQEVDPMQDPKRSTWKHIEVSEGGRQPHGFDVCSPGCADHVALAAVRAFYDLVMEAADER